MQIEVFCINQVRFPEININKARVLLVVSKVVKGSNAIWNWDTYWGTYWGT